MIRVITVTICMSTILLLAIVSSCATVEKEEVKVQKIRGSVLPVDEYGNEILHIEKERILVNLVPVIDNKRLYDRSISFTPRSDGGFAKVLGAGEYTVELFLEGFYVRSIDITVHKGETLDLGVVRIERIEADLGAPVMGDEEKDVILNGGDVNIEPPSL